MSRGMADWWQTTVRESLTFIDERHIQVVIPHNNVLHTAAICRLCGRELQEHRAYDLTVIGGDGEVEWSHLDGSFICEEEA